MSGPMHFVYSALLAMALVLTLPYWVAQALRHGKYRAGLRERLGRVPARLRRQPGCVWVHAVSVGEVLAVSTLVEELHRRWPGRAVVVSTTTATGQKLARQRFGEENVFYFPLDFAFAVNAYLRALRPAMVVVAETEFWANFLRLARASGAKIAVVNARVSDRSYPRYRRFRWWLRRVLARVDLFLAQGEEDARRLREIGAPAERVRVSGNLKFDIHAGKELAVVDALRRHCERERITTVVVCGSTVEGEEEACLDMFRRLRDERRRPFLILAPRHPERFDAVAELCRAAGVDFWRRSQWNGNEPLAGGALLLDTIGELRGIYELATVAFVGGSLVPRGGHSILEPAQFGVAIVVGPHTENFREITETFVRAGALLVTTPEIFFDDVRRLLDDEEARQALGQNARRVMQENAGATERTAAALAGLLEAQP